MSDVIYKVVPRQEWEASLPDGAFQGSEVDLKDGFIHFSTEAQLPGTIKRFFSGQSDLLVVGVRAEAVRNALFWEAAEDGSQYPHLYGALPIEAVVSVQPLDADS